MKDKNGDLFQVVNTLVHNELVKCAVQRKTMTTGELSMCLGLKKDKSVTNVLVDAISQICKDCFEKKEPMLTTVLVKRNRNVDQPTNAWCLFYAKHVLQVEDPSSYVKQNPSDLKKYFDKELDNLFKSFPCQ